MDHSRISSVSAGRDYWSGAELLTPNMLVHPALLLTLTGTKETVWDFWAGTSGCSCTPLSSSQPANINHGA